jgi:hypothetical protein
VIPASAWKVVAILSFIATMVMYAETMLVPSIPVLIKDFIKEQTRYKNKK